MGAKIGQQWPVGAKDFFVSKLIVDQMECQNNYVWHALRWWCRVLALPKSLENWPFWDKNWIKNGSKISCSTNDPKTIRGAETSEMSPF